MEKKAKNKSTESSSTIDLLAADLRSARGILRNACKGGRIEPRDSCDYIKSWKGGCRNCRIHRLIARIDKHLKALPKNENKDNADLHIEFVPCQPRIVINGTVTLSIDERHSPVTVQRMGWDPMTVPVELSGDISMSDGCVLHIYRSRDGIVLDLYRDGELMDAKCVYNDTLIEE